MRNPKMMVHVGSLLVLNYMLVPAGIAVISWHEPFPDLDDREHAAHLQQARTALFPGMSGSVFAGGGIASPAIFGSAGCSL